MASRHVPAAALHPVVRHQEGDLALALKSFQAAEEACQRAAGRGLAERWRRMDGAG